MKKLLNLILLVTTSLLLLSCEKEKYPGAYPFNDIIFFYTVNYIPIKQNTKIIELSGWNRELYPMELWVDNEEIATISDDGYLIGKKEGTVTVYAKVTGTHRILEKSNKYIIGEELTYLSSIELEELFNLGIDVDKDNKITSRDIENITSFKYPITDHLLFRISPYIEQLDSLDLIVYNQTLDLSDIKIKKLRIKVVNVSNLIK